MVSPPVGSSHRHDTREHHHPSSSRRRRELPTRPFRIGIAGPIGAGKTTLLIELVRRLGAEMSCAVITNDVYSTVDAELVSRAMVLPEDRIRGVATGGCPHTAIRDDVSVNDAAALEMASKHPELQALFIESGGDNLTTCFSRELIHKWICVIDVGAGDKIPSKGGPGITDSDLLVVNKADIAAQVSASLDVFQRDLGQIRPGLPFLFTSNRDPESLSRLADAVRDWVRDV
jgi:urease accessory protein